MLWGERRAVKADLFSKGPRGIDLTKEKCPVDPDALAKLFCLFLVSSFGAF